jgi:ribonuclease-3
VSIPSDLQRQIEKKIDHSFRDSRLLEMALLHASSTATENNERLEFLGDRVLGLVMAQYLYTTHPTDKEGPLSKRLNAAVRKETIAAVGRHIDLQDILVCSGAPSDSMLADGVEALIGAVMIDGGYDAARNTVIHLWQSALDSAAPEEDPKSALQEWAQGKGLGLPEYELVSKGGSDHAPHFIVKVSIKGAGTATARGASKRAAEKLAAKKLLEDLN